MAVAAGDDGGLRVRRCTRGFGEDAEVHLVAVEVGPEFVAQVVFELVALVKVMEVFDGLFEADGDEEADGDGDDVDEEVGPGVVGLMWGVDVDHVSLSVWRCGLQRGRWMERQMR